MFIEILDSPVRTPGSSPTQAPKQLPAPAKAPAGTTQPSQQSQQSQHPQPSPTPTPSPSHSHTHTQTPSHTPTHTPTHTQSPPLPISPSPTHSSSLLPEFLTPRMIKFFLLPAVLFTALYTREYRGEHQMIINNQVGGLFYVLFASLVISYIFRRMNYGWAVAAGLSFISLLEVLQYFHFPFMVWLTRNPVFNYLLGNSFNPVDFIWYGMGAAVSLLVLWLLHEKPVAVDTSEYTLPS